MKKLALCAGHYLGTEGRRCLKQYDPNETQEWVLNDRIADRVEKFLAPYDIEVRRIDDTDGKMYIPLSVRTATANEWGADFWCGIHHNAGINGGKGGGITAYVYTEADAESLDWQAKLYERLIQYSPELRGNRASPLARANLAECRDTDMPSVLLELGFMDSSTDVPIIVTEEHTDKCARAIAEVIIEKMGLGFDVPDTGDGIVWYGGALYTAKEKTSVYQTSDLKERIGSLFAGETANIVCSVGNAYGILYDITKDGLPTGVKKIGFVARGGG